MSKTAPDFDSLWFDALGYALTDSGTPRCTEGLDVSSICQELAALATSTLGAEESVRTQVAQSLLADFKIAITADNLGPGLRAALQDQIKDLAKALDHSQRIEDAGFPAAKLLEHLSSESATALAWDDLVAISRKNDKFQRYCGIRDTFIAVARLNYHELGSLSTADLAGGVLNNNAVSVALASQMLGDTVDAWPDAGQSSSLSKDERLSMCRRLWENPGRRAENVVWLKYEFATMSTPVLPKGRITFFNGTDLAQALDGEGSAVTVPSEAIDHKEDFRRWLPDDEPGQVVVRVETGQGPISTAIESATRTVEAQIQAAARATRTGWKLVPGRVIHVIDGHLFRMTRASSGSVQEPTHWRTSPVAMLLAEADSCADLSEDLLDALATLGALGNDEDMRAQRRVVARVEAIERAKLATSGTLWFELAKELRSVWIASDLTNRLNRAATWVYEHKDSKIDGIRVLSDETVELLAPWMSVDETGGRGSYLDKILDEARTICDLLPKGWTPREELAYAVAILKDDTRSHAFAESGRRFDLLLERSKRCRDAASHGWPVSDRAADSVVPFLSFMADNLTTIRVRAEKAQVDAAIELRNVCNRFDLKLELMLRGDFHSLFREDV